MQWTVHKHIGLRKTDSHRHNVIAVAVGDKVYFLHYTNKLYQNDADVQIVVRILNTVSMRWMKLYPVTTGRGGERSLEVPSKRYGHTAVLIDDVIYIWGGVKYTGGCCNVLYAFDVDAHRWFKPKVSGTVPQGKGYHSACVSGKIMYIYGGCNNVTQCNNDVYKLDASTMTWSVTWSLINTRGTPGPVLECHSATVIGTRMFVFGGHVVLGRDEQDNNIRYFDTESNLWGSMPSAQHRPGGSRCHSALAHDGELYVFGGYVLGQTSNDLWRFRPETSSWRKVEPRGKGPCRISKVVCCMVGRRLVVLFGGNRRQVKSRSDHLYILDLCPSLKTLCKVAVIQCRLEQAELPHDLRWELGAMAATRKRKRKSSIDLSPQNPGLELKLKDMVAKAGTAGGVKNTCASKRARRWGLQ